MFQILLIRAGETEYDQQGRIQGTLDVPLSEDGRRQIEALVEPLRTQSIGAIYSSPSQSAQQTAEILGKALGLKVKPLDILHNFNQGLWQGMLVTDVKAKQPKVYRKWREQPEAVRPPEGETVGAAEQRIETAVSKLMKKHKAEGRVALVLPEPLATVLCHHLRHDALGNLWRSHEEVTPWEVIDVTPEAVGAK